MSDEETEEEVWFDILVRRPEQVFDAIGELPPPTKTWTSTHRRVGDSSGGEDDVIKLVLEGFSEDAPSTTISSGLTLWDASDHLCDYLAHAVNEALETKYSLKILELGSGLGKCGLLAHRLANSPSPDGSRGVTSTVLTDGDTNALQLLRKNISRNTEPDDNAISCKQMIWGDGRARDFPSQLINSNRRFDIILGSDIIYPRNNEVDLFATVDNVLETYGKFILAHDEGHGVRVDTIGWAAYREGLSLEVLKKDGQIYLIRFQKITPWNVRSLVTRLQEKNSALEEEVRTLRAGKGHLENKCRCLEERCISLRSDRDGLPQSIMLSFGMDHLASVASFLGSRDLANLSSTCKQFGLKRHDTGTGPVSLWQKIAHGLYESASEREKESLPVYGGERSPFFFYNELLHLRKPIVFEQLFGMGIDHAIDNKSRIVKSNRTGAVKSPGSGGRYFSACTAVCNHVMRSGKHCVRFESQGLGVGQHPLWFGIVRPLPGFPGRLRYDQSTSLFSPLCSRFSGEFNQLRNEDWGEVQCCVYSATTGKCLWRDWNDREESNGTWREDEEVSGDGVYSVDWQGMQSFEGGNVGLLLDYDAGTLTVFKNSVRLGVMKENLSGPYSFFVSVPLRFGSSEGIKVERAWLDCSDSGQASSHPRKREVSEI